MSRTTVLAIYPGDRSEDIEELSNSWLSAPIVWDVIWDRYGEKRHQYDNASAAGDRLWALYDDQRLQPFERSVFMMTFDRAYVLKRDYSRAAADIATFMSERNVGGHWVRLREIYLSDPDYPAIGLHCTSVVENPFLGAWDEEAQDHAPLDWSTAYSIYDEMGDQPEMP